MTDNFIQLKKDNLLRIGIKDSEGKDTGEVLTFDLEDVELLLHYQEAQEKMKKNKQWLKNQLLIIEKRQDVKGKKLLSKNEEDYFKAIDEFCKRQEEAYNIFLGENGVKKLLNGRKMGWTTLDEIDEIINTQLLPYIIEHTKSIKEKIKDKYGNIDVKGVLK